MCLQTTQLIICYKGHLTPYCSADGNVAKGCKGNEYVPCSGHVGVIVGHMLLAENLLKWGSEELESHGAPPQQHSSSLGNAHQQ